MLLTHLIDILYVAISTSRNSEEILVDHEIPLSHRLVDLSICLPATK